jgi:ketosteroid isomerase-like protein
MLKKRGQATLAQMKITEFDVTTEDLYGSGDVVYEVGKYTLKFQLEGQESLEKNGKYVLIWKKMADGMWKRHVDIWNSDVPMQ